MIPADKLPDFYRTRAQEFRAKADEYERKASALEADFKELGLGSESNNGSAPLRAVVGIVRASQLRDTLTGKSYRASDLALRFQVPTEAIEAAVSQPDSGIVHVGRGWLRRVEDVEQIAPENREQANHEAARETLLDTL